MSDELARMDATAQAELVRGREASPAELVEGAIERIEALNGDLNAVIHPLFDRAREEASGQLPDGPFRGVPMLHKDLGAHFADEPYHEGIKHLRDLGWTEPGETWLAAR
jgi:amidase